MTQILLCLFLAISSYASDSFLFRIQGENRWELNPATRTDFERFLALERQSLLTQLPELNFPESFSSMGDFLPYFVATSPEYKGRSLSCGFLAKVRVGLLDPDKALFSELTRNGEICIPRDVPEASRSAWALKMMKFLWERPWIPSSFGMRSLEDQILASIGPRAYVRPEIRILTAVDFDAYGYDQSPADKATIAANPRLKRIFEIAGNFDLNRPETIGELGPGLKKLAQKHSVRVADFFIQKPVIYVTDNWSPEGLVEVLAHEYGHVLHSGSKNIFTDFGDQLEISDDKVHSEAAAESVAWQSLCSVYGKFPETKYFHILKLRLFAQIRAADPHLVGAAAFSSLFHFRCGETQAELQEFLASPGIQPFLERHRSNVLSLQGIDDPQEILLEWE